ncbi:MAG: ComEC/Rec2 family competence protein [Owenweeksia sp.]|nr:ComEC/Rec2 family competence protein [Owenweeksia sp.]
MQTWHRYPLFRAFLALAAGILIANFMATSFVFFLILFITATSCSIWFGSRKNIFFKFSKRWWFGAALVTSFLSLGVLSSWLYTEKLMPHHLHEAPQMEQAYLLQLQENPQEKANSYGTRARLLATTDGKSSANIMLYLQKSTAAAHLQYGDRLLVHTTLNELSPPKNPHEFDYKNYLNLKSIYYQAYTDSSSWQLESRGHGVALIAFSKKLRNRLLSIIDRWQLGPKKEAISKALLLGYRYDIDDDQLKAYASAGAMHVLAVSGLHVGIVYLMAFYALSFLTQVRYGKVSRTGVLILLLWLYACLTGLSASVVRAATMFTFVAIGTSFKRNTSVYNTILSSAMLLLLIKPTYLFEVGFQLSYAAVFGIVWLQPKFESLWRPGNWPLRQLWGITTVSLAAQLATFPLGLYYFHQFPALFLLSNLMVIPLVTVLMYLGIITLLISLTGYIPGYS